MKQFLATVASQWKLALAVAAGAVATRFGVDQSIIDAVKVVWAFIFG